MILLVLPVKSEAQVTLDPGTTAVRFVFSREIERKHHAWMEETVFDEWFDGEVPKICHIPWKRQNELLSCRDPG